MTPIDLIFLYFCACAVSWGAYWMREWERRDRERQLQSAIVGWRIENVASIYADTRRIEIMGYEISKTMHDLINAPKWSNPESNPTD